MTPSHRPIRFATRASRLAQWQAEHVAGLLREAEPGRQVSLVAVSTAGDREQRQSLASLGGTGVFTREIQNAVLDGRADVAVHSLKDLPTEATAGLTLAAVPARGPLCDVLILPQSKSGSRQPNSREESTVPDQRDPANAIVALLSHLLDPLPQQARVGTGSLRRQAQLRHLRPDLVLLDVRGNVETRLTKLDEGDFDGLVLAEAGLTRLGLGDRISAILAPPLMYPAVGQGAIGIECRSDDRDLLLLLERLCDTPTLQAVLAERSVLAALRAGCHAPLGVTTVWLDDQLTLEAVVLSPDGQRRLIASGTSAGDAADSLGRQVADDLLRQGADSLIAASRL